MLLCLLEKHGLSTEEFSGLSIPSLMQNIFSPLHLYFSHSEAGCKLFAYLCAVLRVMSTVNHISTFQRFWFLVSTDLHLA